MNNDTAFTTGSGDWPMFIDHIKQIAISEIRSKRGLGVYPIFEATTLEPIFRNWEMA